MTYNQFAFHGHEDQVSSAFPQFSPSIIHIKAALIPNSFYSIADGASSGPAYFDNNKFYVDEGLGSHLVTVAPGYYENMASFCDAVRIALNLVARPTQTYSVSYSDDNHKITITSSSFTFSLLFSTLYGTEITAMLGFMKVDTGFAMSHTGSLFAQLLPFSSIALAIDELQGFTASKMNGNITSIANMHGVFPLSGSSSGYSRFFINNMFQISIAINGRSINTFTPRLYVINSDNEFKKISLNGIPFTLQIDYNSKQL